MTNSQPGGNSNANAVPVARWPSNVVHDGSDEVLAAFVAFGEKTSGKQAAGGHVRNSDKTRNAYSAFEGQRCEGDVLYGDTGTAARFFYTAKADRDDRAGSAHPTIKPLDLMRWLVRLITPPGGLVLDPFAGSGTTGEAAALEGMRAVLIERELAYCDDIARRLDLLRTGPDLRALKIAQAREERRPTPWEKGDAVRAVSSNLKKGAVDARRAEHDFRNRTRRCDVHFHQSGTA